MRLKILSALVVALGWALAPRAALATCPAIPYVFTDGTSVVASLSTNTNNTTLRSCATTVDNSQIGTNGIFASQIIPNTVATATFGGAQTYTFPLGVIAGSATFTNALLVGNGSATTRIGFDTANVATNPVINNDALGGLNLTIASTGNGYRYYKYDGTTLTQLAILDPSGNFATLGGITLSGTLNSAPGETTIATSGNAILQSLAGNIVLKANGTTGGINFGNGTTNNAYGSLSTAATTFTAGLVVAGAINSFGTTSSGADLHALGTTPLYLNLNGGGNVVIGNGAGASAGTFFTPTGNATVAGVLSAGSVISTGTVGATRAAGTGSAYVAPVYTTTGLPATGSIHEVISDNSCTTNAGGTCVAQTLTFTNSAVWTSATSYECHLVGQNFSQAVASGVNTSATAWTTSSAVVTGIVSGTANYQVECKGT